MKLSDILNSLDFDSYAFGPSVRRSIKEAGISLANSEKVDIVTLDKDTRDTFATMLKANGFQVTKEATFRATTYRRTAYQISKDGTVIKLNVCMPMNENIFPEDVVCAMYNADVNRIMSDRNGEFISADDSPLNKIVMGIRKNKYSIEGVLADTEKLDLLAIDYTMATATEHQTVNNKGFVNLIKDKEIKNMNKEITFMDMLKADTTNAAYRIASTQITNGTKAAILAVMEKQGQDSDRIRAISDLLDTEFGSALVSLVVGLGLTYAPHISQDTRVQRLAGEFRVNGMATAGNAVFETVAEHFLPVVMNAISALPAVEPEKAKITSSGKLSEVEDESEEEEIVTPLRKVSA